MSHSTVLIKENVSIQHKDFKYETENNLATIVKIKTGRYNFGISAIYLLPRYAIGTNDYLYKLHNTMPKHKMGLQAKHNKGRNLHKVVTTILQIKFLI